MTLTIQEKLKDLRVERGLTLEELEKETGISRSALSSYEADDFKDISHYAIVKLSKFYGVTADYLLGLTETKNHPNASIGDLRLSDEMIGLLKSGRVDTAMFSELVTHKDFPKLLADIEIYVNGIAAAQIQNLNSWVDVVRTEIIEEYQPGENDKNMRLLEAAHVNEREYFSSRVHEDIDNIMEDIREAHQGRNENAPDSSAVADLKRDLEEAANFRGSRLEKFLLVFCKQTRIRYDRLTDEEKQWLVKIARKSELVKGHIPQRGRKRR